MEENTTQEKAPKRKRTSDVKTADPKPSTLQDKSTSEQQPQGEPASEQQTQDEPISEQQLQDESISEQQQGVSAAEQPQDKASDTLTSLSSDDSIPLPDYGTALKTFTMKDPSSVPKKPRYSLPPKTIYLIHFSYFLITDQKKHKLHTKKIHVL